MNREQIITKLSFILTDEELHRITVIESNNGLLLSIDLHSLRCMEAQQLLTNIVTINRSAFCLHAIHGFNHGTALKEMIYYRINNKRFTKMYSPDWNPGETFIQVASQY